MIHDLECIVLGSGTSAGIPSIACDCDVCTSNDPRDKRLRTAAALRWTDDAGHPRVLLIDAGPDLRQQVLAAGLDRCDGIFITHNHVDHVFGLDEVRRFNVAMGEPINVWAEDKVQDHLRRVYKHIFEPSSNVNPSFVAKIELRDLQPGVSIDVHGLRVTPIRLFHGALGILGFRFDAIDGGQAPPLPLAWCTDVSELPDSAKTQLTALDTLFLDMLRERRHKTHLNLDEALAVHDALGPRRTWFVHMGHEVSHAGVSRQLPEGVELAFDGLRLGAPTVVEDAKTR
jgi:phosphoribosyl 1,2-cyclic phosphate phosphodiesterase